MWVCMCVCISESLDIKQEKGKLKLTTMFCRATADKFSSSRWNVRTQPPALRPHSFISFVGEELSITAGRAARCSDSWKMSRISKTVNDGRTRFLYRRHSL